MTKTRKGLTALSILAAGILLIAGSGCTKSNSTPPAPNMTTYTLKVKDVLGVSGTATFTETGSTSATIDLALSGAPSGIHPAELCMNTVAEGGAVVITLNAVDATGKSSTVTNTMSYSQLIAYDGFIIVHKSSSEPNVILAQGDIGGNVITATNKSYVLDTVSTFGVSGTALFEKRVNGTTLLTITLTGAIPGDSYPATINVGSITTIGGGPVVKGLNSVNGTSTKSYTNLRKLDSGTAMTYDNWLAYDGYINIYHTTVSISDIICHGNIGAH
jgi:hypothetical protein